MAKHLSNVTLCFLGCGNQGAAILKGVLSASSDKAEKPLFTRLIACVRSQNSEQKLAERFSQHLDKLVVSHSNNVQAVQASDIIILGTDPADIETVLRQPGLREALANKLLISIAAGWTREKLEQVLYGSETRARNTSERAWVVRALPNIAAQVSESLTAIEMSEPAVPEPYIQITNETMWVKAVLKELKLVNTWWCKQRHDRQEGIRL